MARIRTIKPEFFTSADVCSLSPLARLLFIALWCEADREGRLVWSPATLKIRYLPADNCNAGDLCDELLEAGLVELYSVGGKRYAWIPTFLAHQAINNREQASRLPDPSENDASLTRHARVTDASARVRDASSGEGKGREGKGKEGNRREGEETREAVASPPPLFPVPPLAVLAEDASGPMLQLEAQRAIQAAAKQARPKGPTLGALKVLERMAELVGCRYASSPALEARLKEGVPVEDCLAVVEHLAADPWWAEKRFGNAEAPFRKDKFPSYLAQAKAPPSSVRPRGQRVVGDLGDWSKHKPAELGETRQGRCRECAEYEEQRYGENGWEALAPCPCGAAVAII